MTVESTIADFPHGRVPRAVRERQLLELAEALFAERGYAGASMEELARRAGVTKPVVYDVFGSKEGLYLACVERSAEQLRTAVTEATRAAAGVEGKLREGGLAFLRFAVEHRMSWDVIFLSPDGRFADAAQGIRRRQAALVAELFAETAEQDVDAAALDVIVTFVNGGYESLAGWAFEHPDTPLEDLADLFVALLAPGLQRFML
jgi:AcrR family transcriptional regulator